MAAATGRASNSRRLQATFGTQACALFAKNAAQQKRAWKTNLFIISTPLAFCLLLLLLRTLIDKALDTPENNCGCYCLRCCETSSGRNCRDNSEASPCQSWEYCQTTDPERCGLRYSTSRQAAFCSVPAPSSWPALLQVPAEPYRAEPWAPNAAFLYTGDDPQQAQALAAGMFPVMDPTPEQRDAALAWLLQGNSSADQVYASAVTLLGVTLGTRQRGTFLSYHLEPAFVSSSWNPSLYNMLPSDVANPDPQNVTGWLNDLVSGLEAFSDSQRRPPIIDVDAQMVWMQDDETINRQLYCGYKQARCNGTTQLNEVAQAYDWRDSSPAEGVYNLLVWYNASRRVSTSGYRPTTIVRVNQGINKATNAFLRQAVNRTATLIGISDFPRASGRLAIDFSAVLGPLFITWLCQMLLPLMMFTLVYEKEQRLRTMMKMHGLGDAAYWAIQYTWFLALNVLYMWVLIFFGSVVGLSFFRKTDYSLQLVFYLLWSNCLVAFAFLCSTLFRSAKTAVVVAFLYVFTTGLVGWMLIQQFVSRDHWWLVFIELVPGFGLYRGLYEIAQYAFRAVYQGSSGLTWSNLGDPGNGMIAVMVIFAVEGAVFMPLAWYLEQVLDTGVGVPRHPLFFLGGRFSTAHRAAQHSARQRRTTTSSSSNGVAVEGAVEVQVEAEDVRRERLRVEALLQPGAPSPEGGGSEASSLSSSKPDSRLGEELGDSCVVVQGLRKVFPPAGGKGDKVAVRELSLAIERGECFGLLGPNGAGKSTTINILTGFLEPTEGTAWVEGYDIRGEMGAIYSLMGVCPQDNLLWEALTAREHLQFYGRLKNLKGAELDAAIESALRSVNLWHGGVADKRVGAYSGGMKRRLSVAISFMGRPRVVYLDEPSTGLDPASRHNLWDVVKQAKQDRGIILTTHSMEEASVLCDRLGIFVDGQLVCIGNPKELTARCGGYLVFTITTPVEEEGAADALVRGLAPGARLTYSLAGTRKYELPADQVTLAGVFEAMEAAAGRLTVLDWGVANATLEEVFIRFARSIGAEGGE